MSITFSSFSSNHGEIKCFTIQNKFGDSITITNVGATITHFKIQKSKNELIDIVLGFDRADNYFQNTDTYFGATVGRSANRLNNASFSLNNQFFQLNRNDGENNLHSGPNGYQIRLWKNLPYDTDQNTITLNLYSPDGDQGYPGNLNISVTFELTDNRELIITYKGKSDKDTVFNLTNHSYFNLNGHDSGTIENHELQLFAENFTPIIDSHSIPSGEIRPVKNTPFDFNFPKTIGQDIKITNSQLLYANGYDHNFVISNPSFETPFAIVKGDKSGIQLEAFTNLPGVQFYTGNFIINQHGKENSIYDQRTGFCLETQYFPNALNLENFESPLIKANEECITKTIFRISI